MSMDFFRNKRNSYFTMAVFGFIILTFIFWGSFSKDPGSINVLTTVNGEEISYREFQRVLGRQLEVYGQLFGQGKKINKNLQDFIEKRVVSELVTRKVMSQKARALGIVVGKEDILRELEKIEAFQDPQLKRFSPRVYQLVLESNGMNPRSFEKSLEEEISSKRLTASLDNNIWATKAERLDEDKVQNSRAEIQTASFAIASAVKSGKLKVDQKEEKDYFKKNPGQYLRAEKRVLKIASLDSLKLSQALKVSDDEVKKYYDETVKASTEKKWAQKRARAYHILFSEKSPSSLSKAKAVLNDLVRESKQGNSQLESFFQETATQKSEDYASAFNGGDLGYFNEEDMVGPFAKAVFDSRNSLNKVIGPIETDFGYHLIYIKDRSSAEKSLHNRSGEIRFELTKAKLKAELEKIRKEIDSSVVGKANGEEALRTLGFEVVETAPVDRSTKSRLIPFNVLQKSFAATKGLWQEPENFEDNLYVYMVSQVLAPESMSFEEAKTQIREHLLEGKLDTLVRSLQQELVSDKIKWTDLKGYGAEVKNYPSVYLFRDNPIPELTKSDAILKTLQNLTPNNSISAPLLNQGNWLIIQASHFDNNADAKATKQEDTKEILTVKRTDVLETMVTQLIKDADIPKSFRDKYQL